VTSLVREVDSVASDPGGGGGGAPASQACVSGDRPDEWALLIFAEGGDTRG
jgi:hypothetical protein